MILCYANFKTSVMTIRFASITNRQTWLAFRLAGGTRQEERTGWLHLAETGYALHAPQSKKKESNCFWCRLRFAFQFQFPFQARSETFWKSRDPRRFPTDFLAAITFDALRFPPSSAAIVFPGVCFSLFFSLSLYFVKLFKLKLIEINPTHK